MNALATLPPTPPAAWRARGTALLAQPAVRRAVPALAVLFSVAVAAGLWLALRTPAYRPVFATLAEADKAAVLTALKTANYAARVDPDRGTVEVPEADVAAARIMLAGQGLPKAAASGYDLLGAMPLGTSRAVELARLKQAQESELAASIRAIDGVETASVHLAAGETSVFIRDRAAPTAAVFVQLAPGRSLGEAQVRAIVHLVSGSVAGLAPDQVSVVDQAGALLSGDPASGLLGDGARQLGYQARVEATYRQRVLALLTPMLGQGNFSAEVSADVDFTQTEATHESVDKDGVLHTEAGNSATEASAAPPARGIPGALSNTVPPAAVASATPPPAAPAPAPTTPRSESFTRNFEVGKAVSVTHGATGQLRRLSVAVLVRDSALGPAKEQAAQIAVLTGLVRSAVGFDARRGDAVTVAGRPFVAPAAAAAPAWYENPLVARGGEIVAALIALALLIFGVARPAMKRAATPLPPPPPETAATPAAGLDYADKLTATKLLVDADVGRASAVVRQMIRTDAA